ncbi:phosphoethanolamine transferase CptA [Salmonella enterica subsp. enterica serovar Choleraesuis]|nr:phosphoethanolamine transferase CptA [Salmonella enterica subsp. enterica serovar Choleraesuis]
MTTSSSQHIQSRFDWKALMWALLFFWFFSTALQVVIVAAGESGAIGLRDSLLYSSLWLIPILLFPRFTKPIAAVIGIILWLTSVGAIAYYVIYGQEFSQSVLFVLFESNAGEASEFMSQYLSWHLVLVILAYTAAAIFLWTRLRPVVLPNRWRYLAALAIFYSLLVHPFAMSMLKGNGISHAKTRLLNRMEPAAPWQLVSGYYKYRAQLDDLQDQLQSNQALPPLKNLTDSSGNAPRTLVLIIGESTQRNRLSLYGYGRETTPNLDALHKQDKNFTVFNDVVTSRPYTIEILEQALTFADEKHPDLYLTQPSLMNMMKQAGYKTFWITNQQSMTKRNTMLTVFSKQTDEQFYMNQQRNQSARQYDSDVLTPFEKVLKDPAPKKLIIVHLLGTHINYKYRYPETFDKFKGRDAAVPAGVSDDNLETYNSYDNAVLFNDHVVSSLIKDYKATDPNGFLLYFSDHGEEVYDTPPHDIQGRNEEAPTRHMYNIPFMVWTSPKWATAHPRNFAPLVNRKYSSSELIHTWSDLAGIKYDGWDPTRSLVNPLFAQVPRWIGNPEHQSKLHDYDLLPYGPVDTKAQSK